MIDDLVQSQIAYYEARADEYEDFWDRRGAYTLPAHLDRAWRADAADTTRFVQEFVIGDTLEMAAGTGVFTRVLAQVASSLRALDSSPAMLALNRARLPDGLAVDYEVADLFAWEPQERVDTVFMGFWLSHVPDDTWPRFWDMVRRCLRPSGRVVLVDSRPLPGRPTDDIRTEARTVDGRSYQVVKRYWTTATLAQALGSSGWSAHLDTGTHDLMLRGVAKPS